MKKTYEMTREIFNKCSGNQMRDIFIEEIEADEYGLEKIIGEYIEGDDATYDKTVTQDGDIVVNVVNNGLRQRLTFCEL
jgi:hypothetical protein